MDRKVVPQRLKVSPKQTNMHPGAGGTQRAWTNRQMELGL